MIRWFLTRVAQDEYHHVADGVWCSYLQHVTAFAKEEE